MLPVGVMQGRLLPPYEGRFQAFPATRWREELPLARDAGLACIEWIYEQPGEDLNPLRTDEGMAELKALCASTGVNVWSICADYYMTAPLVTPEATVQADNAAHLRWLIGRASAMGVTYMVLPFVDSSSLKSAEAAATLSGLLRELAPLAQAAKVELHLETDLPPDRFSALLASVDHPFVKANYDIGNSASLGYAPREELAALAPWLGSVHVKDRVRGGGTVPLGTGNADLPAAFEMIAKAGFSRWFILQVARSDAMSEAEWCRKNRLTVEEYWAKVA